MTSTLRRGRWATALVTFLSTIGLLAGAVPTTSHAAPATGSISGTISDSHGAVANAAVYVYVNSSDSYASAVTDSAGTFNFTGLPDGTYRLYAVELSHHLSAWYGGGDYTTASGIAVAGNDVSGITFSLARMGFLTGTVRLPNGSPAVGVSIAAWMVGYDGAPGEITDAAGHFSIGMLPSTFIVQATPADTYPIAFAGASGATSMRSQAKAYSVAEDETVNVDITLFVGTVFSGTVTSNGVAPSHRVSISARQQNGTEWTTVGQAYSDAGTGNYTLIIGAGTYYITFYEIPTGRYAEKKVTVGAGAASQTLNVDCLPLYDTVATPTISGEATVGSVLTAHPGSWSPTPDSFTYQWLRNDTEIPGATAATYTVTTADVGARLAVVATANKAGYFPDYYQSAPTAVVPAVPVTPTPALKTITGSKPKITGTAKVGKKLTVKRGTWSPSGLSYTYRWYRNGKAITSATKSTYKLTKSDKGKYLAVKVTAKRSGYQTLSLTSKKTSKVR